MHVVFTCLPRAVAPAKCARSRAGMVCRPSEARLTGVTPFLATRAGYHGDEQLWQRPKITERLNAMTEEEFGDFRRKLGSEHQGKDRNQILDVMRFNAKKTFSEDFLCEILGLQTEYQRLVTASINSAKAALMAAEASVKSAVAGEIAARSAERSARAAEKAVILMVTSIVVAIMALAVSLYVAMK